MDFNTSIDVAQDFLQGAEGFSDHAYFDTNGYAIGYGNHYYLDGSPVSPGDTITSGDALALLRSTIIQVANTVLSKITVELTENQLAALTSLAYNCGAVPSTLRNLINNQDDPTTIRTQFLQTCTTSGGVYNPDLADRRAKEADLYFTKSASLSIVAILVLAGLAVWALFSYSSKGPETASNEV